MRVYGNSFCGSGLRVVSGGSCTMFGAVLQGLIGHEVDFANV